MAYCGADTLVKYSGDHPVRISRLRCRSWHCEECQPGRRRRLMAEIIGGRPNIFLTLTTRPRPDETPVDAAKRLSRAWRLLRMRIKRRYGWKTVPCLTVLEKHISGFPHLHVFLRTPFIPQRWLSEQMAELCDGPVVHIRAIDNHGRASAYAAKYTTKANAQIGKQKRYYKAPSYDLRADPKRSRDRDPNVTISRWSTWMERVVDHFQRKGWTIEYHSVDCAFAQPPPARAGTGPPS